MSSYATSQLTFCVLDITARIALTDLHRVDGLRARRLAARRRMLVLHRHLGARHGRHQRDGFGSGGDGTGGFEGEGLFVFARSVVFSQLLHDRALRGQHQGNRFSLRWFAQQTLHVHVRHISKGNLRRGHPPEWTHEWGGLLAALSRVRHVRELSAPRMIIRDC